MTPPVGSVWLHKYYNSIVVVIELEDQVLDLYRFEFLDVGVRPHSEHRT